MRYLLNEHLERMSVIHILTFTQLAKIWIERNKSIRSTKIQSIVNAPINLQIVL